MFSFSNGCNKLDKRDIDDLKKDVTRVRYCPLHAHQCVTNYPRHVFKREAKKARSRPEWHLGPGWTINSTVGNVDSMEMINDDYASSNLWERQVSSASSPYSLSLFSGEVLRNRGKMNRAKKFTRK